MSFVNASSKNGEPLHLLFVVPRYAAPGEFYQNPIGLAMVYAFAKRAGVSVSCLNLCHEYCSTTEALTREFDKRRVDVICTSGMSKHWEIVNDILVNAKNINSDIVTVVGGPIITADPELAIMTLPVDYGVVREGEYTLLELLEIIQGGSGGVDSVKGLAFKGPNGKLVRTGNREAIKDLDSLPFPEYVDFGFADVTKNLKELTELPILETDGEVRYVEIIGSRSCPFSCTFCYHPLGRTYRQRSLDHIFSEIDYLTKTFGVNFIGFNDELFSVNQKRMLAFAERIKPYNIKFFACFRVNDVKHDVMEKLYSAGMVRAFFGIESMNDTVLESMRKKITRVEIINALEVCRLLGIEELGTIILGDPAETFEAAMDSIAWWLDNPQFNISMGFILAVPDAPFYREAVKKGLIPNKLSHTKSLPLVNVSKMTDRQYFSLVLKVAWWNHNHANKKAGKLLGTRKLDECFREKHLYEIRVKCPFCGGEQTQKKYYQKPVPNVVLLCNSCLAHFKIPQKQAFPDDYSFMIMAIYMCGKLTDAWLARFSFFRESRIKVKAMIRHLRAHC